MFVLVLLVCAYVREFVSAFEEEEIEVYTVITSYYFLQGRMSECQIVSGLASLFWISRYIPHTRARNV